MQPGPSTAGAAVGGSRRAGVPVFPGRPLLGHLLELRRDPVAVFLEGYRRAGPVFRLPVLHRQLTVAAGLEANTFLARQDGVSLSTISHYGGMARELGSEFFVLAMDGAPHKRARRLLRPGFSKSHVLDSIPELLERADLAFMDWGAAGSVDLIDLRRLVIDQLGQTLGGVPAGGIVHDLWRMLDTILRVTAVRTAPRLLLMDPRYRRARARVFEFVERAVEDHRQNPPAGRRRHDHIDDLLAIRDEDGEPLDRESLHTAALGPFAAGLDTVANTLAFILHNLVRHPEVLGRVRKEVDEVFGRGMPDASSLRRMPTLHGVALETLRVHPVTPAVVRMTTQDVEIGGQHVPAGTDVIFANAVTHYLDEHFPDPDRFDPDRYGEGRREHTRVTNAYAPFALGPHTCLGAGIAEMLLALDVGYIVHRLDLSLLPAYYELDMVTTPVVRPRNLRFSVGQHRSPPVA